MSDVGRVVTAKLQMISSLVWMRSRGAPRAAEAGSSDRPSRSGSLRSSDDTNSRFRRSKVSMRESHFRMKKCSPASSSGNVNEGSGKPLKTFATDELHRASGLANPRCSLSKFATAGQRRVRDDQMVSFRPCRRIA